MPNLITDLLGADESITSAGGDYALTLSLNR
jgi:hypothetical protein